MQDTMSSTGSAAGSTAGQSCPDCHALVADLQAHERWHTRLVSDLAKAVERSLSKSRAG